MAEALGPSHVVGHGVLMYRVPPGPHPSGTRQDEDCLAWVSPRDRRPVQYFV